MHSVSLSGPSLNGSSPFPLPVSQSPSSSSSSRNEPVIQSRETNDLSFRELAEQLHQLARFPKLADPEKIALLSAELKNTIRREPCFQLEQYQTRILQLRGMLEAAKQLPGAESFCVALEQQLAQTKNTAEASDRNSAAPVYERILRLPSLAPDFFGAAVAILHEELSQASQNDPLITQIKALLPKLFPPTHYLWNQASPFTEPLLRLEELKQASLLLLHRLKNVPDSPLKTFYSPLKDVVETYRSFLEKFNDASDEKKEALCVPKAQLSGAGLGFFLLDREVASDLLSLDAQGNAYKKNAEETRAVCYREGVFYESTSKKGYNINPGMEFAVYAFHQLLGSRGIAPTAPTKVRHLFLDGQSAPYESSLQAGYGVEGIPLQDFLAITNILPFLENCLGAEKARGAFEWLLQDGWQQEYLKNHPELDPAALSVLSTEESSQRLENTFASLFSSKPANKRCFEFSGRASDGDKAELFKRPVEMLVKVLALLQRYSGLAAIAHRAGIRQVKLIELVELCSSIGRLKQYFPALSTQQLLEELPQLMSRFDRFNFSAHFVASLLTNPSDHKAGHFMVVLEKGALEQGETEAISSLSLVSIRNDQALDPSAVSTKTVLYLFEQMAASMDRKLAQQLSAISPQELIFDWLVALEAQNQRYKRWQRQWALAQDDLLDGVEADILLITIDAELVPALSAKATRLIDLLRADPATTHRQLLEALQPRLAEIYRQASEASDSIEESYEKLDDLLQKEPQPLASSDPKQTPAQAAGRFLKSLDLGSFPLDMQVSLLGKAQDAFPALADATTLPGDPADPSSRREFFLLAVASGYHALAARLLEEEKTSYLEREKNSSLLALKNEAGQTPLFEACCRLNLDMVQLLLRYGADAQAVDPHGQNVLLVCLARFSELPEQTAVVVRFLVEHSTVLLNVADEPRGWTCLHRLVELAHTAPEEAEVLIDCLIEKGANPDLADQQGKTAFDYAMQQNQERLVHQFIRLGAGRTLDVQIAKDFLQSDGELYTLLQARSLPLRWHLALEALREFTVNSQIGKIAPSRQTGSYLFAHSPTLLAGLHLGRIQLSQKLREHLLDEEGNIRLNSTYGGRNVNKIVLPSGHTLFFQPFPEMPGVEYAVGKFFELLIGHGTSATDLAKITLPNGRSYPVLISLGIEGDSLHEVLNDPLKAQQLEKLDSLAFAELFIASLLVNFEDAQPDHFILETRSRRLISVQNEHAFAPTLLEEDGTILQAKNVLYRLELMKQPLHASVRQRFLSLHPEHFLRLWLELLAEQNERYCALFPLKERRELFKGTKRNPGMVIPIPLKQGAITAIYRRLQRLQVALQGPSQLTGIELLRLVVPELSPDYEVCAQSTPPEPLLSLAATQPPFALNERSDERFNSRQKFGSMALPEKAAWEKMPKIGPFQALEELESLKQDSTKQLQFLRSAAAAPQELGLDTNKEQVAAAPPPASVQVCPKPSDLPLDARDTNDASLLALVKNWPDLSGINLSNCHQITDNGLQALAESCHNLSSIDLSGCAKITDSGLQALARSCPNLSSIGLNYCKQITYRGLQALAQSCPRLSSVSLSGCNQITDLSSVDLSECNQITDSELRTLAQSCPKLSSVNLSGCAQITYTGLQALARSCPNLSSVNLSYCEQTTDSGLQALAQTCPNLSSIELSYCKQITYKGLQVLARSCPNLSSIKLHGCNQITDLSCVDLRECTQITDNGLQVLAQSYPNLSSVDLSYCKQITDSGLQALARNCPNLTSVNLNWCERITDSGLEGLAISRPNLSSVELGGCTQITDRGLQALARNCPHLSSSVNLNWCKQITDSGLGALTRNRPNFSSVELCGCDKITDRGLQALARNCPNLTSVDLGSCNKITDSGLQALASSCPNLTSVDLKRCNQITDSGLQALASSCPNLSSVELSFCDQISDRGLQALTQSCPNLSSVGLWNCNRITDSGLEALARNCPNLTYVRLGFCNRITDSGLLALASSCPNLSSVILDHCEKITDSGLQKVRKSRPCVTFR